MKEPRRHPTLPQVQKLTRGSQITGTEHNEHPGPSLIGQGLVSSSVRVSPSWPDSAPPPSPGSVRRLG